MSWKISLYLGLIISTAIITWNVIQFILSNLWILIVPAILLGLPAIWYMYNWGLIVRERRLTSRVETEIAHAKLNDTKMKARLIDTSDGTWIIQRILPDNTLDIASLHNNPLWEINGHRESVTQAELFAWQAYNRRGSDSKGITQLQSGIVQSQQIDLLSILDTAERVLFEGPPDAGKTTLCLHVASRAQGVIIVDPHNEPNKWPVNARIIGGGRNFGQILKFIDWMVEELDRRAKMADMGNRNFIPTTIIIDELPTLILNCGKGIARPLAMMLVESRKFKFRIFIGAQSKLLKLLGLEGMGDVRKGLVMVHLSYDQITKQRFSTINIGNGEQPCFFPPFNRIEPQNIPSIFPDLVLQPNDPLVIQPTPKQAIALDMWDSGERDISAIATRVYGLGGRQEELVRNTLRKFERI